MFLYILLLLSINLSIHLCSPFFYKCIADYSKVITYVLFTFIGNITPLT